jgi:hypothetical protein
MNWKSQSEVMNPQTGRVARGWMKADWMFAALFLVLAANGPAQAQGGSSLADIARQARAQKAQGQPATDSNHAQQVADELSEDANDNGAPGGFKTFNAGDYTLFVPAPYRMEGHDDAGVVLSGPNIGSRRAIILVGSPIVAHFGASDDAFHDAATQFVRVYAQSANCAKTTVAKHSAYQCSMAAANLTGQLVGGNAVFVMGSGVIYPVFCVAPTESNLRDYINNKHTSEGSKQLAEEGLGKENDDIKKVLQKCETVFESIHIREGIAPLKEGADPKEAANLAKPAPAPPATVSPAVAANTIAQPPAQPEAPAARSTIPAGFKLQAFNYCKSINECWDASVLVPTEAQLVSSDCKQYVFEMRVQGSPFLLLMGPAACDGHNDPASQVRWKQLVDPESARAPGSASTVSAQQMKLDGKPAVITQMRFKKNFADWLVKRAEVDNNGAHLVVGCMSAKENFADGDAVCSGLIGSLRLP